MIVRPLSCSFIDFFFYYLPIALTTPMTMATIVTSVARSHDKQQHRSTISKRSSLPTDTPPLTPIRALSSRSPSQKRKAVTTSPTSSHEVVKSNMTDSIGEAAEKGASPPRKKQKVSTGGKAISAEKCLKRSVVRGILCVHQDRKQMLTRFTRFRDHPPISYQQRLERALTQRYDNLYWIARLDIWRSDRCIA